MRARMILAAGLMALTASLASAQAPTTFKSPLQTPVVAAPVTFASGCARGPVVVNGSGSCSGYTSQDRTRCSLFIGGGTSNPAGCGCFASERTFFWGGCKQFFTPQNDCGKGCCGGHGDRFRNKCALPTYGSGLGVPANNCAGPFSYIMR